MLGCNRVFRQVRPLMLAVFLSDLGKEPLHLLRGFDVAAKGDGAAHTFAVVFRKLVVIHLGQGPPAAKQFSPVVEFQLAILGKAALNGLGRGILRNRQNDHFVIC